MESAVYGRMSIGRCVKNDYGHLGCQNDVLSSFDRECSGKQSCQLMVTTSLRREVPGACTPAIAGYVDASYQCRGGTVCCDQHVLPLYDRKIICLQSASSSNEEEAIRQCPLLQHGSRDRHM